MTKSTGKPAIVVEDLYKRYTLGAHAHLTRTFRESLMARLRPGTPAARDTNDFWALNGVDLRVDQGEVVGIIGRNGSGKSTLLKILSRIAPPTRGRVQITGRVASLLEVGTGFHPELTGRENIFLNGAVLGMSSREIRAKFDDIVAFSETEQFLETPLKRYSSGMQVRLAFAVAAHLETDILLVDEVLAVGDVEFQRRCLGKMTELVGDGRTVLFVSHDIGAVRRLCPKCLWLNRGDVAGFGDTNSVLSAYLSGSGDNDVTIKLPPGRNPDDGGIATVTLTDEQDQPARSFPGDGRWKIKVRFNLLRSIPRVCVSSVLLTSATQAVRSYQTRPLDLQRGEYEAEFLVDDTLTPDDLQFNFYLTSAGTPFYFAENVVGVQITDPVNPPSWTPPFGPILMGNESGELVRVGDIEAGADQQEAVA